MSATVAADRVAQIVENRDTNPFEILGPHPIQHNGKTHTIIRAYLPDAEAAWVIRPTQHRTDPMHPTHHPHFFECEVDAEVQSNYQIKVKHGDHERVFYDPYAFKSPLITDFDIHLFGEGNHHRIYEKMGAHFTTLDGIAGTYFAVWAPNARNVSVIGDFNDWDGRKHQMRAIGGGIWDLFIPGVQPHSKYKFEIKNPYGHLFYKSDPYGFYHDIRPDTASIVATLDYTWNDQDWLDHRRQQDPLETPISVYEVHIGSWLHASSDDPPVQGDVVAVDRKPNTRFLTYRELAAKLIPYVQELGYTHVELLPITEYPFDGSWGYQVTGLFAPTSRYGTPQDFMYFVDQCHQAGIGVIIDWVPGHFPKDAHGLAFFDGTHLYEHEDWRKGEHKGWGTLVPNYSRHEVRNFYVASAIFWFDKYHIDGIRVDAVASMLYLDYDRKDGDWIPNEFGGRENLEAVEFLRQLNQTIFDYYPGVLSIAEESTAWPNVSRPTYLGGLGFNLKWNMGWMHDMLYYFSLDPIHRRHHQNNVTFGLWYAFNENFMLALSHDEVVHGKGHLYAKMPGDHWQKMANLRALFAYMYTHPGKKTLFAGMEFGQTQEWNAWHDLEWPTLQDDLHRKLHSFVTVLNNLYRDEPALHTEDFKPDGFEWVDCNDAEHSVVSFLRKDKHSSAFVVTVCNFTPNPLHNYWVGVPEPGYYVELLNSDEVQFGGSGVGNGGGLTSVVWENHHRWPHALPLTLPPLGVLVLKLDPEKTRSQPTQP